MQETSKNPFLSKPVKGALLLGAGGLGSILFVDWVQRTASTTEGFCMLLLLGMFLAGVFFGVVLPAMLIYRVAVWLMRRGKPAAQEERPAAGEPAAGEREQAFLKLRKEGRLDRLALVYYVEASRQQGCAPADVNAALKAKGWPEADIAAAFQSCGWEPA